MEALDNRVRLRILGRDWNWENVEVPQLSLKTVACELGALVVNDTSWTWITR